MAKPLNLANVQGDVLVGLAKETETFYFFEVIDIPCFRSHLSNLIPLITTSEQAQKDRSDIRAFKVDSRKQATEGDGETPHPATLPIAGVNIAFTFKGIEKIGITDVNTINDAIFQNGMLQDASNLGDKDINDGKGPEYQPDWDATFLREIHGVILVTGDCHNTVNAKLDEVKAILASDGKSSIKEIATLIGDVRPGDQRGHEHFGYKDGISQPAIDGVDVALPGQTPVQQGVVLLRREGDPQTSRPEWALDGSFMAFRKLPQLVPEFESFVKSNAPAVPNDPTADTAGLLGARLVGRWKSGAPVARPEDPIHDDPDLGNDPQRNNHFNFIRNNQEACPFASHIRKMNPRGDLDDPGTSINPHLIPRRGIPFGIEVTDEEKAASKSDPHHERGLYFVCYQSDLSKGFSFLQKTWANSTQFPFPQNAPVPGEDAIIGQTTTENIRTVTGFDIGDTTRGLPLDVQWVGSKGGEYFFSPSIPALRDTFSAVPY